MSLRLRLAALWLPEWLLRKELERLSERTTAALDELLATVPGSELRRARVLPARVTQFAAVPNSPSSLAERRAAMAAGHAARVQSLADAVGRDEALRLGREALYRVGLGLGQEVRVRLGVGNGLDDLLRAAKVLYRVLGIHFEVMTRTDPRVSGCGQETVPSSTSSVGRNAELEMCVRRCALAERYAPLTCAVLSATDEGVVHGLNPRVTMAFREYLPAGAPCCIAKLVVDTGFIASSGSEKDD